MLLAHLLLLPPRYNFYQRKSEKLAVESQSTSIPLQYVCLQASCNPRVTIFTSGKAKTDKSRVEE